MWVYISGYASVFNAEDYQGDLIKPGAFKQSIAHWKKRHQMPPMLWQHKPYVIGKWLSWLEDKKGLWVEGKLNTSTYIGNIAWQSLLRQTSQGLSIGFTALEYRNQPHQRIITETVVHEISIVRRGANPWANIIQAIPAKNLVKETINDRIQR